MISLLEKKLKPRTINSRIVAVKSFAKFISQNHNIPNPTIGIKLMKADPPGSKFLTKDQYLKLLAVCDENFKPVMIFMANTGLRVFEVCKLTWSSFDETSKMISFDGKGRKRRTVPVNKTAMEVLETLYKNNPDPNDLIFTCQKEPYNHGKMTYYFSKACGDAKIPGNPHGLRHFFASQLILDGVPMAMVSKILGHASVKTTEQFYSHIRPVDLAGLTDSLDSL